MRTKQVIGILLGSVVVAAACGVANETTKIVNQIDSGTLSYSKIDSAQSLFDAVIDSIGAKEAAASDATVDVPSQTVPCVKSLTSEYFFASAAYAGKSKEELAKFHTLGCYDDSAPPPSAQSVPQGYLCVKHPVSWVKDGEIAIFCGSLLAHYAYVKFIAP